MQPHRQRNGAAIVITFYAIHIIMMCLQAEEAHLRALMLRKGQKRNCVLCPDIAHYLCALQTLPAQTLLQGSLAEHRHKPAEYHCCRPRRPMRWRETKK